ncbi:transposase-like zinc-binding domain-containing protein [Thomasclavelia sp.]
MSDHIRFKNCESLVSESIDEHFSEGYVCPHCHSRNISKNGHVHGKQRFICHDCHRSFRINTDTLLDHTHLSPAEWLHYIQLMNDDATLRKSAEEIGVSLKTSFFMRHKIMNCLSEKANTIKLSGICEMDEFSVNMSYSRNHTLNSKDFQGLPRQSYKRGRNHSYRYKIEITDEIMIASAVDRKGHIFAKLLK